MTCTLRLRLCVAEVSEWYSLCAERFNGIDGCSAGGREKGSGESSDGQEKRDGDKGYGIVGGTP